MAKGDKIEVYVRGVEGALPITVVKAGRTLGYEFYKEGGVQWLRVTEKTWTGKQVAQTLFQATDVLAITTNFEQEE